MQWTVIGPVSKQQRSNMEEFDLDLTLDEAAEARIAHADYLNRIKDWGVEMGTIIEPFTKIAMMLLDDDRSEDDLKMITRVFPIGLGLAINHLNEFYEEMQKEAVKILGAPFMLHDQHHPLCDMNEGHCGHQDHYMPKDDE